MTSLFQIGVSGLLSNQHVLGTVGHNIANVNTEGYSRQRVELVVRPPQGGGDVYFGSGVNVGSVTRVVDGFIDNQLRVSLMNQSRADVLNGYAAQLNNLFGDAAAGLSPALTSFFDGVQEVADDPASVPSRQVLLSEGQTLVARFNEQARRLNEIADGMNLKLGNIVADINSLADNIARLNREIVRVGGVGNGSAPNDLLDTRDLMLQKLAGLTEVQPVVQDDGALNVMIGKGQVLVAGGNAQRLAVVANPLDSSRLEVAFDVGGVQSIISAELPGGAIGGVLESRETLLDPARNALGRIAVVLADSFNAQHRSGMDLDGNLGGDFFSVQPPQALGDSANTGSISLALDTGALGSLTTSDYALSHDGTNFTLLRLSDRSSQTLTGAGPFNVDGMLIAVTGAPAAGDRWLLQPTRAAARDIALAGTGVRQIAAAAPVRAQASRANVGAATVSGGTVLDITDPNLLNTTTLVINDPPTTFQVNGAGPLIPFSSGANIDVNGWRVQITGAPLPGDQFVIGANSGGVGDNRNALALVGLQSSRLLDGGNASYGEANSALVSQVGTQSAQARTRLTALSALTSHARDARAEVSGVNLDEEAANLMRFQQAYQASAQVISSAQAAFDTLLRVLGS
ncbi:MAG: flagellar hook-associated protein FlgK [Gammaproteobacteria bacterium]|nr:flagellar hook-associated protein FlgK [Gammaproteobacteria bacterium]